MKISIHEYLMAAGQMSGCHQMPERSFFFRGKQFPVCARCTGCLIGYAAGMILYFFYVLPLWLDLLFCGVMLADWLLQYFHVRQSTNIRRLVTGILCGIAWVQMFLRALSAILPWIAERITTLK